MSHRYVAILDISQYRAVADPDDDAFERVEDIEAMRDRVRSGVGTIEGAVETFDVGGPDRSPDPAVGGDSRSTGNGRGRGRSER